MERVKRYRKNAAQVKVRYTNSLVTPNNILPISFGEYTYGKPVVEAINWPAGVAVGRFCSIAAGVQFLLDVEHRMDWVTTYPFPVLEDFPEAAEILGHPYAKGDISIGNDVWIGKEAMIFSGVTIGDGAVIGARAVVTQDVPAYAIVAGNPARVARKRFSDKIIESLLEIQWWNWPLEKIRKAIPLLCNEKIEEFIDWTQKNS
ncbi:CatB-related O-acetyltransferase [uncultured Anaeromusa sp.]|uniref:CatB-related O-acetyltransferase n=1 Tax=uncultured Anaeromusa sp. TaxID=673273 RepID=UPI0029C7D4D5|nr:CatB-related O-acetyltransferase [uncultured Anaeromusa sp.]